MKIARFAYFIACMSILLSCNKTPEKSVPSLKEQLYSLTDSVAGMVGIAFVSDTDTVTVNNGVNYPMMSVFKLHQSLAVADMVERNRTSLDSVLYIKNRELDRNTWSPMLKEYDGGDFSITIRELIEYSLISSDNNASNLLFKYIATPKATDEYVKSVAADTTFQISYSESDMKQNHNLCYLNHTSPLSAALIIRQLFTTDMTCHSSQEAIKKALTTVTTGQNRLGAAIAEKDSVLFAHKTGSGYRNEVGALTAHNDVGYFRFPEGQDYSLAVFIRDFNGSEDEASSIIAKISKCVYEYFKRQCNN